MTAPSLLARLAGAPLVAVGLFITYAGVVIGWAEGELPWWLALCTVVAAAQTLKSVGRVRRSKAWAAEWHAMGAPLPAPPLPSRSQKKRSGKWVLFVALALLLVIPACVRQLHDDAAGMLICLWLADCLYLTCRLIAWLWRALRRSPARPKAERQAKLDDAPVAWLLPRASDSPSRATAQKHLPDYAARLIRQA